MNLKYIYFGSSPFSLLVFNHLIENDYPPLMVVTYPKKPIGRKKILTPNPLFIASQKHNILTLTPEKLTDENFLETIKKQKADFALLAGYGKIIPLSVLNIFPYGFLNLHPSLLPKYRGATPIQSAILNGDKETGVTLFKMDEEMDHGPIIAQKKVKIEGDINSQDLEKILAQKAVELFLENIDLYLQNKIKLIPQDEKLASYCFKFKPEDEKINWEKTLKEIDQKIRAFNPKPGVYTEVLDKNNKILKIKIIKGTPIFDPSLEKEKKTKTILNFNNQLAVKCPDGLYILEIIKPASKKEMKASDFLKGNPWIINKTFF
jgi:methionyl-tRNA formyltransferase